MSETFFDIFSTVVPLLPSSVLLFGLARCYSLSVGRLRAFTRELVKDERALP